MTNPMIYGTCEDCSRIKAIKRVIGRLANGEPYGYCATCTDKRETPATGSLCAVRS